MLGFSWVPADHEIRYAQNSAIRTRRFRRMPDGAARTRRETTHAYFGVLTVGRTYDLGRSSHRKRAIPVHPSPVRLQHCRCSAPRPKKQTTDHKSEITRRA